MGEHFGQAFSTIVIFFAAACTSTSSPVRLDYPVSYSAHGVGFARMAVQRRRAEGAKVAKTEVKPLPTSLWELLDALCTAAQIQELLRPYKEEHKDEITLSVNKPELIENLKSAVGKNIVPRKKVTDLICEAEENGRQHIFYYVPKNDRIRKLARDGGLVGERIWGIDQDEGFPLFDLVPNDYRWSDFRIGLDGKPNDWVSKIYGHKVHQRFTGREYKEDGLLYREFDEREERIICLARWNDPDLFEVRVQTAMARLDLTARRDKLWEMMGMALRRDDFVPWDLQPARRRMVDDEERNKAVYQLGDAILQGATLGTVAFHPHTEHEKLGDAPDRKAALSALRNNACNDLAITWQLEEPRGGAKKPEKLRTVSGGRDTNELSILAHTSSRAVDYVTNRLREFSR